MDQNVAFIQILDTSDLKMDRTSKLDQWKNLEASLESILPIGHIKTYTAIAWDESSHESQQLLKRQLSQL